MALINRNIAMSYGFTLSSKLTLFMLQTLLIKRQVTKESTPTKKKLALYFNSPFFSSFSL